MKEIIYHDSDGNERTLSQMVRKEPMWAANRIRCGEKAEEQVANLAMLVRRLVVKVSKTNPNDKIIKNAIGYLKKHGLEGNPLH